MQVKEGSRKGKRIMARGVEELEEMGMSQR